MSLNKNEISQLVAVVRGLVKDLDNAIVVADQIGFTLVYGDLVQAKAGLTRNQMAVLVNRFYAEGDGMGSPKPLAES